jgi:hypothetical protein
MLALARSVTSPPLLAPADVLEMRANVRAFLWYQWQIEMDEAVDELQAFAEQSGLVADIGQDAVQAIIAAPFDRYRERAAAVEQKRAEAWERRQIMLDQAAEAERDKRYRTAKSTIDAFWFVVRENNPDNLSAWLAARPRDAAHLHQIWKEKCSTLNR